MPGFVLRKAHTNDVVAMRAIINHFADKDLMLPRSLSQLYENIRDFFVIEEDGVIAGCAALHVSWKDLAELKSLAVADSYQGKGYGRLLIDACMQEADVVGVAKVFALTYVPEMFEKMGFDRVDKALLPRKVWTECVFCSKFNGCTEVAVLHHRPASVEAIPPPITLRVVNR